ncbi:uncharacterized protein LOC112574126 [Pomacea canaliculata]|uniref:uncharacterized protein LOC112574126 n=1 Tax=Pomacea canaliculata TaxID=400727 RepID=UPI000D7390F8|nr:uncharacterized protein LOC112574126 [Pomacea canaliculata]
MASNDDDKARDKERHGRLIIVTSISSIEEIDLTQIMLCGYVICISMLWNDTNWSHDQARMVSWRRRIDNEVARRPGLQTGFSGFAQDRHVAHLVYPVAHLTTSPPDDRCRRTRLPGPQLVIALHSWL